MIDGPGVKVLRRRHARGARLVHGHMGLERSHDASDDGGAQVRNFLDGADEGLAPDDLRTCCLRRAADMLNSNKGNSTFSNAVSTGIK